MGAVLRSKVYLSDEGFGHIVRQRAVIEELRKLNPNIAFTVQSHKHIDAVSRIIPDVETIDRYNNITWHKQANGSPDVPAISRQFEKYESASQLFVEKELEDFSFDFILSDFVYEAFEVGEKKNIPAFGISHFTWDWFFSKLYPPPLSTKMIHRFFDWAHTAKKLYFPPFTPEEILNHYSQKAFSVPLILRSNIEHKLTEQTSRFKIMIIESGAGVLYHSVKKAIAGVAGLSDYQFYVSSKFEVEQDNVSFIHEKELMVDYINDMDLVIGRAGFNTISECIGLRTPMLLIGEAMNPEMSENIINLKKAHLGSFISMETFESGLENFLPAFIKQEYRLIKQKMNDHTFETNGAAIIARDIMEELS